MHNKCEQTLNPDTNPLMWKFIGEDRSYIKSEPCRFSCRSGIRVCGRCIFTVMQEMTWEPPTKRLTFAAWGKYANLREAEGWRQREWWRSLDVVKALLNATAACTRGKCDACAWEMQEMSDWAPSGDKACVDSLDGISHRTHGVAAPGCRSSWCCVSRLTSEEEGLLLTLLTNTMRQVTKGKESISYLQRFVLKWPE